MKRIALIVLLLPVVLGAGMRDAKVTLDYFTVERGENQFSLAWQASVEDEVVRYELWRKTTYSDGYGQEPVKTFTAHGRGKAYRFTDTEVYKVASEQVDYRLDVVDTSGQVRQIASRSVNYTPTAVRRTWGSIKAMFQ